MTSKHRFLTLATAFCASWAFAQPPAVAAPPSKNAGKAKIAAADQKKEKKPDRFVRVLRDAKDQPIALETSVVRFTPKDADFPVVDLIGAVHVGDKEYYDQLNREFLNYDAVLYELVAAPGANIPGKRDKNKSESGVSFFQRAIKSALKLEFQLDEIDYTKPNFVHADMSPSEFSATMAKRGESIFTMIRQMMAASMKQQLAGGKQPNDLQLIGALLATDDGVALKRIAAEQLGNLEVMSEAMGGKEGSTIITERNKKALEVLRARIDANKGKSYAIFYGAGHFPDMEERLVKDFGLVRRTERWVSAWKMPDPPKPAEEKKK
jgi:hypothetical protein